MKTKKPKFPKAVVAGKMDARDYMKEHDMENNWTAASDTGSPDDFLISQMGREFVEELFGVSDEGFSVACAEYNTAWRKTVRAALKRLDKATATHFPGNGGLCLGPDAAQRIRLCLYDALTKLPQEDPLRKEISRCLDMIKEK